MSIAANIAANIALVQQQIASACRAAGRADAEVRLMAVSKMHPAAAFAEAVRAGIHLFGENRVQEFQAKSADLLLLGIDTQGSDTRGINTQRLANPAAEVHLIGPLQSNKAAKAAGLFHAVDTIDSARLAARLNDAAAACGKTLSVLIEIKLSHEASKHGLLPGSRELEEALEALPSFASLRFKGLMTVPPFFDDPEQARPYFRQLRAWRERLSAAHPRLDFSELSMGMSHDFAVAIEEGSTCVRIGTAIFGKRMQG
ncbi:MAG: YggS family pyridoxal phosphate-dependent enzyme [Acidobacteriaceae bacterium]